MSRSIIIGIDLGTHSVKVVIASAREKNEKGFPKIIATASVESEGLRHGYVNDVREATKSVKRAIALAEEKSGIKIKKAFVGIGGVGLASTVVTSFIMTSRADAEITALDLERLLDQCEKDIPPANIANRRIIYAIPLQYKIDGTPSMGKLEGLSGNRIELKMLFITCLNHHAADIVQAVNDAGIEVEDVMVAPIAAGFATLSKAQKIAGCVLANIGAETTSIAVFENSIPTSLQVFPIGSMDFTNDIALGLKVPLEEAEQIKIGAITGTSYPRKKLEEIIVARASDIFDLIETHLKKIGRNGLLPAGIVLSGGGSALNSIAEAARIALHIPSRVGALEIIEGKPSSKDAVWSVAYGLCIWGINTDETGKNLETTFTTLLKRTWVRIFEWVKQFLP